MERCLRWGADPMFWANVKLFISDIHSLAPAPGIESSFMYMSKPISRVHIVGTVVAVQDKARRVFYSVDDGSGLVECTHFVDEMKPQAQRVVAKLGDCVRVLGSIKRYFGRVELKVSAISVERDIHAELMHWIQVCHLKDTEYAEPPC